MANSLLRRAVAIAAFALIYQLILADLLALLKPWRTIQPLSDFPTFSCQRMTHPAFEGCEDMWLDDEARLLYAACTGTKARMHWAPTVGYVNVSMRPAGGSWISVLSIDQPKEAGLFPYQKAKLHGYENAVKGGPDLLGFDVEILANGKRRFWLVNQRPPVDTSGEIVDTSAVRGEPRV